MKALLKFPQRWLAGNKWVVRKAVHYNPNSRFGALVWKHIVNEQTAFWEFYGYPLTDGSHPDDHIAEEAKRQFAISEDAGWNYLNFDAPLDSGTHQLQIERRLIKAGVLHACPGCPASYTVKVTQCGCGYGEVDDSDDSDYPDENVDDTYDYDPRDDQEHDDFVPMSVIHSRARAAIGDPYLADEAARMCPGDFIY